MSTEFPEAIYESVRARMAQLKESFPQWGEFSAGWMAVLRRYEACRDHHRAFTAIVPKNRYIEERKLFEFFFTGQSAIESFCYSLFAISSKLRPQEFPMDSEGDKKSITPRKTSKLFKQLFPDAQLTGLLTKLIDDAKYKEWKDIRDVLAHRSHEGRTIMLSTVSFVPDLWINNIEIDKHTTETRFEWLSSMIANLVKATDDFTEKELPAD